MGKERQPEAWTEVNIELVPGRGFDKTLLLKVADPLVHEVLAGSVSAWFMAQEKAPLSRLHLRLRVRWESSRQASGDRALECFLDAAEADGMTGHWYRGCHGIAGIPYAGEEAEYGDLWPLIVQDWTAASELALAIARQDPGTGGYLRHHYWSRCLHMFSNALGLGYFGEAAWCAAQAAGYLEHAAAAGDPYMADPGIARAARKMIRDHARLSHAVERHQDRKRREAGEV